MFCGVFCGDLKGFLGNIGSVDGGIGEFFLDGNSDAAGAGADVEDNWVLWKDARGRPDAGEIRFAGEDKGGVDELFGFGAGDEDVF